MTGTTTPDPAVLGDIAGFWTAPIEERAATFAALRATGRVPFAPEPVMSYAPPGMFRELLTRVPGIHATGPPRRLRSMFINGVKELPVTVS